METVSLAKSHNSPAGGAGPLQIAPGKGEFPPIRRGWRTNSSLVVRLSYSAGNPAMRDASNDLRKRD